MARFDISQYSTVAERIDKFWEKFPNGRILTDIVHFSSEQVVVQAGIYLDREDSRPVTTDFAEERPDTSPVNRVSMVENCTTSAIGRALADLGGEFTGSKRPSAEEMQKVARHENRQAARDWLAEAKELQDVDALRLLWAEASKAGASPELLGQVKNLAEQLSADGESGGNPGSVPASKKAKK